MVQPTVLVAGPAVRARVRSDGSAADRKRLSALGLAVRPADIGDANSVAATCEGAACVVSALNGLNDVIIDRQGVLLDGAVQAAVPRFISSDYLFSPGV